MSILTEATATENILFPPLKGTVTCLKLLSIINLRALTTALRRLEHFAKPSIFSIFKKIYLTLVNPWCLVYPGSQMNIGFANVPRLLLKLKKVMFEIVESNFYRSCASILGEPRTVDDALEQPCLQIALNPDLFQVLESPDIRIAHFKTNLGSLSIIFKIIENKAQIELLSLKRT